LALIRQGLPVVYPAPALYVRNCSNGLPLQSRGPDCETGGDLHGKKTDLILKVVWEE